MRGMFLSLALCGLAGSTVVCADGLLIPTDRTLPPLRLSYQRVEVAIDCSGRHDHGRAVVSQHDGPRPRGRVYLSAAGGRLGSRFLDVGRRQAVQGQSRRRARCPADLRRHRPPVAGSRPARIHRSRPLENADLPRSAPGRAEDPDHLHVDLADRGRDDLVSSTSCAPARRSARRKRISPWWCGSRVPIRWGRFTARATTSRLSATAIMRPW